MQVITPTSAAWPVCSWERLILLPRRSQVPLSGPHTRAVQAVFRRCPWPARVPIHGPRASSKGEHPQTVAGFGAREGGYLRDGYCYCPGPTATSGGMSREWATEPVAVHDVVGPLPWSLGVVLRPARWGACSRCVRLPHLRPVRVVWVHVRRRYGCGLHGVRPSTRGSPPIRRRPTAGDFLQTPLIGRFPSEGVCEGVSRPCRPKEWGPTPKLQTRTNCEEPSEVARDRCLLRNGAPRRRPCTAWGPAGRRVAVPLLHVGRSR